MLHVAPTKRFKMIGILCLNKVYVVIFHQKCCGRLIRSGIYTMTLSDLERPFQLSDMAYCTNVSRGLSATAKLSLLFYRSYHPDSALLKPPRVPNKKTPTLFVTFYLEREQLGLLKGKHFLE